MTKSRPDQPVVSTAPKRSMGQRFVRWLAWVFGPSVVVGAIVWFLLRGKADGNKPLILAAAAAVAFGFLWQWLRMRLRKTGRGMAYAMRSMLLALLVVGVAVAAVYLFWIS